METPLPNIAETIALGVAFDPKNNGQVRQIDLLGLFDSVGKLFDLLEERNVDYVVAGGIAMLAYVEGRNTQDINLLLSSEAVSQLPELNVEDENDEFLRARFGDLQVDVLLTGKKLFGKIAASHSTEQVFADRKVSCATPEGLVMLKLFALPSLYRQGNLAKVRIYEGDIESLLATYDLNTGSILNTLREHLLASDIDELASITQDIHSRIAGKKQRFKD